MCSNILLHCCTVGSYYQQLSNRPAGISLRTFLLGSKPNGWKQEAILQLDETTAVVAKHGKYAQKHTVVKYIYYVYIELLKCI